MTTCSRIFLKFSSGFLKFNSGSLKFNSAFLKFNSGSLKFNFIQLQQFQYATKSITTIFE